MQYTVSMNQNYKTEAATAIIIGLSSEEISRLESYLEETVAQSSRVHPLMLLVALADLSSIEANHWRSDHDQSVFDAIKQTRNDYWLGGSEEESDSPVSYDIVMDQLNFHELTRTLTSLALSTSGAASYIKSQIRILSFLDKQLQASWPRYMASSPADAEFKANTKSLKEKVESLRWELESIQQQNTYFQDATQALVQTVICYSISYNPDSNLSKVYSLVAQRDNKLNMEVAS
jgi:hypothetical protein